MNVSGVFPPLSCVFSQQKAQVENHQSPVSWVASQALEWVAYFFSSLKAIALAPYHLVVNLAELRLVVTTKSQVNKVKSALNESEDLINRSKDLLSKAKMISRPSALVLSWNLFFLGCTYGVSYMNNSYKEALNAYPLEPIAWAVSGAVGGVFLFVCCVCTMCDDGSSQSAPAQYASS